MQTLYKNYEDFTIRFIASLQTSGARVLKQYRGNGGNGVYKVVYASYGKEVIITHAKSPSEKRVLLLSDFYNELKSYFSHLCKPTAPPDDEPFI